MSTAEKNIFIYTMPNDWHAILAEAALKRRGHRVLRYYGSDFPQYAEIEYEFNENGESLRIHTLDGSYALSDFDVVWNRRMLGGKAPDNVDPRDLEYVSKQIRFADAALRNLLCEAFWINPYDAARNADQKPKQLQLAVKNGLRIPDTLITNRPQAIRDFLRAHPRTIHKPLIGAAWHEDDMTLSTYTAMVTAADLPSDELLRASPGIFQALIPKQFEVRAQFFGASYFALKIDPSRIEYGELDWRLHQNGSMTDGSVEIPEQVYHACLRQLDSLGLVAGAFDFIVTPDGDWVYLEVNEAGQFIFVEQWCDELLLFDALCGFIESGNPWYRYHKPFEPIRLAELMASVNPDAVNKQDQLLRTSAAQTQHAEAA